MSPDSLTWFVSLVAMFLMGALFWSRVERILWGEDARCVWYAEEARRANARAEKAELQVEAMDEAGWDLLEITTDMLRHPRVYEQHRQAFLADQFKPRTPTRYPFDAMA